MISTFVKKIKAGLIPDSQDWINHLQAAHQKLPNTTPQVFENYRTPTGANSYQILALTLDQIAINQPKIVDLACGSGHLITYLKNSKVFGVDMSDAEIKIAKEKYSIRADFYLAEAQQMPFTSNSMDAVLCHLGVMLMQPLEAVLREIYRILKPEGVFSFIIDGEAEGVYAKVLQIVSFHLIKIAPEVSKIHITDPVWENPEALERLFEKVGFKTIESFYFKVENKITPNEIWDQISDYYLFWIFDESDKEIIQKELVALGKSLLRNDGKLDFEFSLRKITLKKVC